MLRHFTSGSTITRTVLVWSFVVFASACSSPSPTVPTPTPSPSPGATSRGTMSARINGVQWTAIAVNTATNIGNILSVGAADGSNPIQSIGFAVTPAAVGTYSLATGPSNALVQILTQNALWQASILGGSGTITISTLTSTGVSGTFAFTAVPSQGTTATGNRVVTDGVFNLTF